MTRRPLFTRVFTRVLRLYRTAPFGHTNPVRRHRLLYLLVVSVVGGGALSCGDTSTAPAPTQAYWRLKLNYNAVNLALTAPYDTAQLTATPLTIGGTPLTGAGPVTFQVSDSNVTVSPTGVVTAHYVTAARYGLNLTGSDTLRLTYVIASLTVKGVTLADTAFIQVTVTPPASSVATFSLQPAEGDSAKRAVDFSFFPWLATVTDAAHDSICNQSSCTLMVHYQSSNEWVAKFGHLSGVVSPLDTGRVVLTASTLAYGVPMRDSVAFTIGYKLKYSISLTLAMVLGVLTLGFVAPKKLILGVGAVVTFCSKAPQKADVVFDHPEAIDTASCVVVSGVPTLPPLGSGNIAAFGGDSTVKVSGFPYTNENDCRARRFNIPGTYRYHSTLFPSDTFEIVIKPEQ